MKLSGDVAFPTMLQSVLCLVFLFSVKVFFGQNIQNRGQNYPRGGGGGELVVVRVSFVAWLSFSVFGGSVKIEN